MVRTRFCRFLFYAVSLAGLVACNVEKIAVHSPDLATLPAVPGVLLQNVTLTGLPLLHLPYTVLLPQAYSLTPNTPNFYLVNLSHSMISESKDEVTGDGALRRLKQSFELRVCWPASHPSDWTLDLYALLPHLKELLEDAAIPSRHGYSDVLLLAVTARNTGVFRPGLTHASEIPLALIAESLVFGVIPVSSWRVVLMCLGLLVVSGWGLVPWLWKWTRATAAELRNELDDDDDDDDDDEVCHAGQVKDTNDRETGVRDRRAMKKTQ